MKITCSHSSCSCQVEKSKATQQDGKSYCSSQCANAAARGNTDCSCGHANCEARHTQVG